MTDESCQGLAFLSALANGGGVQRRQIPQRGAEPSSAGLQQKSESSVASSSDPPDSGSSGAQQRETEGSFPDGQPAQADELMASSPQEEERPAVGHVLFDTSSSSERTASSLSGSLGEEQRGKNMNEAGAASIPAGNQSPEAALDEEGNLLSIGSSLHASRQCKPCIFLAACHHGLSCRFCHVADHDDSYRKTKIRPCKGKRDQYKNLIRRTFEEIERSPESFDLDDIRIPSSVDFNPKVREKFLARISNFHKKFRSAPEEGTATQPSNSSAPSSSAFQPSNLSAPSSSAPRTFKIAL